MGAWVAVGMTLVVWIASSFILPAERRWRRAPGVLGFALFVGATVWLLLFSAGAAVLLAAGASELELGEAATIAGAVGAALTCVGMAIALRRWEAEE